MFSPKNLARKGLINDDSAYVLLTLVPEVWFFAICLTSRASQIKYDVWGPVIHPRFTINCCSPQQDMQQWTMTLFFIW